MHTIMAKMIQQEKSKSWNDLIRMSINIGLAIALLMICLIPLVLALPAGWSNHVVISEVYSAIDRGDSEFVELYNPTATAVNISGWTLQTELEEVDVTIPSNSFIPAYGFYLIADLGWPGSDDQGWPQADHIQGMNIGKAGFSFSDSGIALRNKGGTIIDAVGWGNSALIPSGLVEGTSTPNPQPSTSLERKPANNLSNGGNGIDTNNNAVDFINILVPHPQNSQSSEIPEGAISCNTAADTNCDSQVSNLELAIYANLWFTNAGVTNIQLAIAAQAWFGV